MKEGGEGGGRGRRKYRGGKREERRGDEKESMKNEWAP
jgi:hypothetical protein